MRECPSCKNNTLRLKNIFTLRYKCDSCGSVCTSSTGSKAVGNILINVLPVIGVVLAIVTKSAFVFLLSAIVAPLFLCWWHQKTTLLHVVNYSK